jgi:hypothetical protein
MMFVATKMVGQKFVFPPPLLVLLLDPGWIKSGYGIWDKHSGSATLGLKKLDCKLFIIYPAIGND